LLVIRDLMLGRERFKDFLGSPESIPTNILADRLERLVAGGLVETVAAADGTRFTAYRLTAKGEATRAVLGAVRDWGLKWLKGTNAMMTLPDQTGGNGGTGSSPKKGFRNQKPREIVKCTR
jgi:DNA-binding HxlR family transcriptional regulator